MTIHESALEYARKNRGSLPRLAKETGLSYQWLKKLVAGDIADPGVKKIERLLNHKNQSAESAKAAA